jgi:hypothetical protein
MIDLKPFSDFNEFFAWYINIIKSKVDGYNVGMGSDEIHLKMGKLTRDQFEQTNRIIRKIQKIPKGIVLVNDNKAGAFYSRWNNKTKKAEIAYPSVTYYWLRYPDIIKGAIQHEIGHIVNQDILINSQKGHEGCINRSMDCRINQNIDYTILDYINRCLFTFNNEPTDLIVPETWMVKQCGLPVSMKSKVTWTYLHSAYHQIHPEPLAEDRGDAKLDVGTYVKTKVDKHGEPKGTFGIITNIKLDVGKQDYIVGKISQEEIDALINEDFEFFENLKTNKEISYQELGEYEYNRINKELSIIKKPIVNRAEPPKVGDIALTIRKINTIPEANFGMVVEKLNQHQFVINEFTDEIQKIVGKGDASAYYEALFKGENIFGINKETGIFLEDFILRNLTPPMPSGGGSAPETTKQIEKPMIGDVVVITTGSSKGKYGVIKSEDEEGNYEISEVSEEVAKAIVGKK